ncbi:ABC transporter substrate-binding protein [Paenibacillus mendelii]|uniref:ABC transporter substrate-binding protein n=1 Tax=Paenibacillus mendelii TaxID=206163 RepID=A0ABV6J2X7_9BACL|nr:ABC transporter substrate-binding protein [Paenibacillus mendelii]MCQ6559256.1 ABC transporter substrate-binding protein [Paenibacillus mendelii]
MRARKLKLLLLSFVLVATVVLNGCTEDNTKVFRDLGGWPKPPLFQGNPFASGGVGQASQYTFEGLFQIVRSTDKIYKRLAESVEHKGNETIIKIRPGVTWQDGKPFTSKDVWSYYMLNNGVEITKHLTSIEIVDDTTITFKWQEPSPFTEMKDLFLAQDQQATIPYHLYGKYIDKVDELLKQAKKTDDPNKKGPFGLEITDKLRKDIDKNWQDFLTAGPKMPVGTGPFIVKKVTASDMILEKNENYWKVENIHFDRIFIKNPGSDSSGLALLKSGKIDTYPGTPPRDILENMLATNKDLVHYRMFDPATIGMVFNLDKPPFDNQKFRQAVVYALDRTKIREVGNYYGQEADVSMTGMPQSELTKWITPENRETMTKFTYNPDKAGELLTELGWKKGADGNWADPSGTTPNFIIGVSGGWLQAVNSAQIAAEQMTKFGLPTKLLAVDGSVYYNNSTKDKGAYHMSVDWVDVSWGFMFPWNSLRNFYWGGIGNMAHLPKFKDGPDKGKLNMKLPGPDGQVVDIEKTLQSMPYLQKDEERKDAIFKLAWITNENAYGVGFFQNTTGYFENVKTIKGWPREDEFEKYDRSLPVPTEPDDIDAVSEINFGFGGITYFVEGRLSPRE